MRGRNYALILAERAWRAIPEPVLSSFRALRDQVVPYQKVTYKGRTLWWGRDRSQTYRTIFSEPPIGKSILDVGCHTGFYCFMAASEGAKYCLGIEISKKYAQRGQALIRKTGIQNFRLVNADIFGYDLKAGFDIVLCLNLLHHLQTFDQVETLIEKLWTLADERLVLMVPLLKDSPRPYEYVCEGNVKYVHFSQEYFRNRFGTRHVQVIPVTPESYGDHRIIVFVAKRNWQPKPEVGRG